MLSCLSVYEVLEDVKAEVPPEYLKPALQFDIHYLSKIF